MATALPDSDFERVFPFDSKAPSPTVGGRNLSGSYGPADQSQKVESRPDAVLFSTGPLPEPFEVTGRVWAGLWVAADAPDADVAVRLTDVYPDGRSILIRDGIVRLSRREGCDHETVVVPGEPVAVDLDLWSTSWIFNTGHRLRLVVTGSNHPRFELNPAIAAPAEGVAKPVALRVFGGPARPSALWVPVPIPGGPDAEPGSEEPDGPEWSEGMVAEPAVEILPPDVPQSDAAEPGLADEVVESTETGPDVPQDRPAVTEPHEMEAGSDWGADVAGGEDGLPPRAAGGGCALNPRASAWAVLNAILASIGLFAGTRRRGGGS